MPLFVHFPTDEMFADDLTYLMSVRKGRRRTEEIVERSKKTIEESYLLLRRLESGQDG